MTAQEYDTVRDEQIADRERLAAEAFARIRSGQHWRDWTLVSAGLEAGRTRAMREAHANQPMGKHYNRAFGEWMDRHRWPRQIDKATRAHLFWVADHLPEIEQWRETLASNVRDQLNHPTAVKRRFEASRRLSDTRAAGAPVPPSPTAQLRQALVEAEEKADRWERKAREGGSLFDLHRDTARDIGDLIVRECSPTRAENIAKEIRLALKRRGAHAG